MRKFMLAAMALVLLAGCNAGTAKNAKLLVYKARVAYDAAVLVPARRYADACVASPTPTCRSVVHKLAQADKAAKIALDAASAFVLANPTSDASALITAADVAISAAIALAASYGIHQ